MSSIKFRLDCIPPKSTGQAGLRILKRKDGSRFIGKIENSKSSIAKNELLTLIMPHRPRKPLEGAIRMDIKWIYPWKSTEPKKNRVNGYKYCDKKPDCDNLTKLIQDQLSRLGFWIDDAQVAILHFEKMWADEPGIEVEITELDC